MDDLLKLYLNLNYTKTFEEEIVRSLKDVTAPWIIKEQVQEQAQKQEQAGEEQDDDDDDSIEREIQENLEHLKRVEELLNKAQKVYTKATAGPPAKPVEEIKPELLKRQSSLPVKAAAAKIKDENEPKQSTAAASKSTSRLPLANKITNNKKAAPKPVYMNAPYKTESYNAFKHVKPRPVINKAQSVTNIAASAVETKTIKATTEHQPSQLRTKYPSQNNLIDDKPVKPAVVKSETVAQINAQQQPIDEKVFTFSLKTSGKELRLPPNLEELVVKNNRMKQLLMKNSKVQGKASQSRENFKEKLEKSYLKQSSAAFLHHLINKMCFIYDNLTHLVKSFNTDTDSLLNDDAHKLKVAKLHAFSDKLDSFQLKLNQQMSAIYSQMKTYYSIGKDTSAIENKLFSESTTESNNDRSLSPISYKNETELRKYFNLKLSLIELEFKRLYLDYVDSLYLNDDAEGRFTEPTSIEQFNLLFNFVTNKQTIIVKQ